MALSYVDLPKSDWSDLNEDSHRASSVQQNRAVAIIPARGGSKGLKRKNIRLLGDKPLLAWSIAAARNCRFVDRVVVSTEDEEIAEIANEYGAEVPFLRPNDLAEDNSFLSDVLLDTLKRLNNSGFEFSSWVTLYPTQPFRSRRLMDYLVGKCVSGCSKVTTVTHAYTEGHPLFRRKGEFYSRLVSKECRDSGNQYFRPLGLLHGESRGFFGNAFVHVVNDPICQVDIDTLRDFYLAEEILARDLFDFENGGMDAGCDSGFSG